MRWKGWKRKRFRHNLSYYTVMERRSRTTKPQSINQILDQELAPDTPRIQSKCPCWSSEFSAQSSKSRFQYLLLAKFKLQLYSC